jgi:hypothetical protein
MLAADNTSWKVSNLLQKVADFSSHFVHFGATLEHNMMPSE